MVSIGHDITTAYSCYKASEEIDYMVAVSDYFVKCFIFITCNFYILMFILFIVIAKDAERTK